MLRYSIAGTLAIALAAMAGATHAQTMYRYQDANGRVVYSDQPPPPSAKNVQPKQLPENVIEIDQVPFATRDAAARFPVTLYTFDCDVCKEAQALLAKRGVPFTTVIVTEAKGGAQLKALTGQQSAPVLQIGDKQVLQGYNEVRWEASLDDAGYPKSGPPARQPAARAAPPAPTPAATPASAGAAPAPSATPAAPPSADAAAPGTPAKGSGYPQ